MNPTPFEPKLVSVAAVIADTTRSRMLSYLLVCEQRGRHRY